MKPKEVLVSELELGDVVELSVSPYGTATVCNVTENEVEYFRPYTHHEDFTYTGGIICYVGIEKFKEYRHSDKTIKLLEKCSIKLK